MTDYVEIGAYAVPVNDETARIGFPDHEGGATGEPGFDLGSIVTALREAASKIHELQSRVPANVITDILAQGITEELLQKAHDVAKAKGYCEVYDEILRELGLPPRPREFEIALTYTNAANEVFYATETGADYIEAYEKVQAKVEEQNRNWEQTALATSRPNYNGTYSLGLREGNVFSLGNVAIHSSAVRTYEREVARRDRQRLREADANGGLAQAA